MPHESVHWINVAGRATLGINGKPLRMAGLVQDITERKLSEEALKEAVRARDEFISICSHELKTPITSMKLQFLTAQKLIQNNDLRVYSPEQVQKRMRTANRQLDRMSNLIEEMLDVSKIGAGKLQMNFEALDLGEIASEVMERFSKQFSALKLEIAYSVTEESILIIGDRFRLEQVLANLITNAIKYGSGSPISVSLSQSEHSARLRVEDQGIGIPKESLDRIFQRFERAVSAANVSGLGLGLYICHEIIEAHAGKIWVESDAGKGSTFYVEIPLASEGE